jgi:hypothetical protein
MVLKVHLGEEAKQDKEVILKNHSKILLAVRFEGLENAVYKVGSDAIDVLHTQLLILLRQLKLLIDFKI